MTDLTLHWLEFDSEESEEEQKPGTKVESDEVSVCGYI